MSRSIFVTLFFLAVMPFAALGKPVSKTRPPADVEPPRLEKILANTGSQSSELLSDVVAIDPEIPRGPLDVLKDYERDMTLIAQKITADLTSITQAEESNQITREQAEYLIQERYQVSMMQYQTLSALHYALERDVAQAATLPERLSGAREDTAVVVELPSSGPSGACK